MNKKDPDWFVCTVCISSDYSMDILSIYYCNSEFFSLIHFPYETFAQVGVSFEKFTYIGKGS